jgi:hypothetical protein
MPEFKISRKQAEKIVKMLGWEFGPYTAGELAMIRLPKTTEPIEGECVAVISTGFKVVGKITMAQAYKL